MNKRERIYASIRRQPFDALPWQFDLTSRLAERLRAYYGTKDLLAATDDHMVWSGPSGPAIAVSQEGLAPGEARDEFGVVRKSDARDHDIGDWGEMISSPISKPSLSGYRFPDSTNPGRWSHLKDMRGYFPDHFLVLGAEALFQRGWSLCGFENYLSYIAGEPKFIEALNERLTEYSCALTRQAKGLGADAVRFGDDWGLQHLMMLQPRTWRRLFKPYYQRIYGEAKAAGLVVMIHSCGDITAVLPDLIEIGVEVVHPLQPEAMDVVKCQREFGKDLTFWGGLGSQSTLPKGTVEDNRREVKQRLELFAKGGYILAPAGAAPTETPVENIAAIVAVAQGQLRKS